MPDIDAVTIDTLKCVLSKFEITPETVVVIQPAEDFDPPPFWHEQTADLIKTALPKVVFTLLLPKGSLWQALQPPNECPESCKDGCLDEYPEEYEWLLHWGYECGWRDAMRAMKGNQEQ